MTATTQKTTPEALLEALAEAEPDLLATFNYGDLLARLADLLYVLRMESLRRQALRCGGED